MVGRNAPASEPPEPRQAAARSPHAVYRAGVVFLLDMMTIVRDGRHPIDALLLLLIVQANTAPYATGGYFPTTAADAAAPPDELRRPISINALANSLRLPFESIRRRVHRLAEAGLCHVSREGVIVPSAVLTHPDHLRQAARAHESLRRHYGELRAMGVLADPKASGIERADAPSMRIAGRTLSDHLLRVMDLAHAAFGDLVACLLLLEVFCANTEHLPQIGPPAPGEGSIPVYPDRERRPLRVADLARRSGFLSETTRRHTAALVARGMLERTQDGLIVPGAVLSGPAVLGFALASAAQTQRLFSRLSELGSPDPPGSIFLPAAR